MASWKEERDRLVAQTLAFVQQVAAAHPAAASKLGLGSSPPLAGIGTVVASPAADTIELPDAIDKAATNSIGDVTDIAGAPVPANILADLPKRPTQYAKASERSDISQRVAAFQARQTTLNREREAYYDSVQARIRSSLRNDTGPGRL
jgi:hypothetical protein